MGGSAIYQPAQGLADRVVIIGYSVGAELGLRARHIGAFADLALQNARRNTHGCGPGGHGLDDDRVAADLGAIAHFKSAQHFGTGADDHVFA